MNSPLVNLLVSEDRAREVIATAHANPSWTLTPRQLCDLELLANGGFSPLQGFLGKNDYDSVLRSMRLVDGAIWPIPVTLGVSDAAGSTLKTGQGLVLRDPENSVLAMLTVEDLWRPDREAEAEAVFGTANRDHAGVAQFMAEEGAWYVAGKLEVLPLPEHYDFVEMRHTPAELRELFAERWWDQVVAFQTRNPMHRAHFELTLRALISPPAPLPMGEGESPGKAGREVGAKLLLHPSVGVTKEGDVDHYTRVRCYKAIMHRYPEGTAMLSLLPLAMRLAGPREALWHALIRKNHGCTHFIIGRDHAGPGNRPDGRPFYEPYAAQELAKRFEREMGIAIVSSEELSAPEGKMSGTDLRRLLAEGKEIPEWFTFPEVAAELRRSMEKPEGPGVTVLLTGLSGSGKSTIAKALVARLKESGVRGVSLIDGDLVRRTLSADLGFSKEDRETHVRRIAQMAADITREGGIAVCAVIAPYEAMRAEFRRTVEAVEAVGAVEPVEAVEQGKRFVLVYVATPLEVAESRDRKGLYAKARAGALKAFTGISDPYEVPKAADLTVKPGEMTVEKIVEKVIALLPVGVKSVVAG